MQALISLENMPNEPLKAAGAIEPASEDDGEIHGMLGAGLEMGKADVTHEFNPNDEQAQLSLRLETVASLLPAPTEQRIFRKAVQAVHSYPTNGEHTALTRRLFNVLVEVTQEVFRKTSQRDRDLIKAARGTPKFSVPTRRLMEMMDMSQSAHHERVHAAMESLFQWDVRWNLMGDDNGTQAVFEAVTSRIISQWGKGEGPRLGLITFEFPHDVLMMVLEPRPYAQLDLRVINELNSAAAIGLYECCARYLGTIHKVTATLPVQEWISMIAAPGRYKGNYFDFVRYCLKPAIAQLEATPSCPFTVEPKVIYGARRKVVGLQFKMHLKQQRPLQMEMPMTWEPKTIETLLAIYRMDRNEIAMLARIASEAEVLEAISRDSVMVARKQKQGDTISNRANYLRGILRNVQAGKERNSEPEEEAVEVLDAVSTPRREDATLRIKRLREAHKKHRIQRLKEEMELMPTSELEPLRMEFEAGIQDNLTLKKFMVRGWEPAHPAITAAFYQWVHDQRTDITTRMLRREDDNDLTLWMMLNPETDKTSSETPGTIIS